MLKEFEQVIYLFFFLGHSCERMLTRKKVCDIYMWIEKDDAVASLNGLLYLYVFLTWLSVVWSFELSWISSNLFGAIIYSSTSREMRDERGDTQVPTTSSSTSVLILCSPSQWIMFEKKGRYMCRKQKRGDVIFEGWEGRWLVVEFTCAFVSNLFIAQNRQRRTHRSPCTYTLLSRLHATNRNARDALKFSSI